MMKKRFNDKGMAMITVLITITFIAILAASLLYMTYLNYMTKSMRTSSVDNFYSDEFALDELSSNIQEIAADCTTVEAAVQSIRTAVGGSEGDGNYDPAKLQSLITTVSADPNVTITVSAIDPSINNYHETSSTVKFDGVHITSTTASGYVSEITTDITITFPSKPKGDYDINDFSVISDSYVVGEGKAGAVVFTGCTYMIKKGGSAYAFRADSGRVVSFMGDYNIIDGDMYVVGNSAVYLSGITMVDGDIYLERGSVIMNSGDLKINGSIKAYGSNKGQIVGTYTESAGFTLPNTDATSLATDVFAKNVFVYTGSLGNPSWAAYADKCINMAYGGDLPVEFFRKADSGLNIVNNVSGGSYDGYHTQLGIAGCTHDITNSLVLNPAASSQLKYLLINSTMLSLGPVSMPENQTGQMSRLEDDAYVALKELSLGATSKQYDSMFSLNFANGNFDKLKEILTKKFVDHNSSYDDYIVMSYNASSNSDPTSVSSMTAEQIAKLSVDDEIRYVVAYEDGGKMVNLVPIGYLLAPDSSSIIASYISGGASERNPKNTTVTYSNWSQD